MSEYTVAIDARPLGFQKQELYSTWLYTMLCCKDKSVAVSLNIEQMVTSAGRLSHVLKPGSSSHGEQAFERKTNGSLIAWKK
jgi:hypothetical protein